MSDTSDGKDVAKTYPQVNQTISPFSCPPPALPNPYIYPYSLVPPQPYFSVPPPFPLPSNATLPYNYYSPISIPPPCFPPYQTATGTGVQLSISDHSENDFKLDYFFPKAVKKSSIVSQVKLWEVSRQFRLYYRLLKDLEDQLQYLSDENVMVDVDKLRSIASKQEQLVACKNSFNEDPTFLMCLKYKINQRRKKRMYRRRKRKNKTRIHIYEIASEHMQQLEQEASRIRQEEKLKQEADDILSSVIQKKADARYQIQLLQNLLKLHSARVHRLTVETNFTPDTSITGFEKVLEKLIDLWEVKMREYTTEENGLKLMINELAVNAEDENIEKLKEIFDKWLEFMFGTRDLHGDLFYCNFEQLIAIRQGWDKFVVDENDSNGSKIPGGWVVPKYNENKEWNKFLFN